MCQCSAPGLLIWNLYPAGEESESGGDAFFMIGPTSAQLVGTPMYGIEYVSLSEDTLTKPAYTGIAYDP